MPVLKAHEAPLRTLLPWNGNIIKSPTILKRLFLEARSRQGSMIHSDLSFMILAMSTSFGIRYPQNLLPQLDEPYALAPLVLQVFV